MGKYGQPLETVLHLLKGSCTVYEKQHGIYCTKVVCLAQHDDLRFYLIEKSDRTKTLAIVFRTGVVSDSWLIWNITENQANILSSEFGRIYRDVNEENRRLRLRIGEEVHD